MLARPTAKGLASQLLLFLVTTSKSARQRYLINKIRAASPQPLALIHAMTCKIKSIRKSFKCNIILILVPNTSNNSKLDVSGNLIPESYLPVQTPLASFVWLQVPICIYNLVLDYCTSAIIIIYTKQDNTKIYNSRL